MRPADLVLPLEQVGPMTHEDTADPEAIRNIWFLDNPLGVNVEEAPKAHKHMLAHISYLIN